MLATYNAWLVWLSIVVAIAVSYTSLQLAGRVAAGGQGHERLWLMCGALAMGVGIWSMHFIGMMAYSVPIALRYDVGTTLLSLLIAVLTSGFAIRIASRPNLALGDLAVGSLIMGAGIVAMHYCGMAAIPVRPGIGYSALWVGVSVAIAISASFVALWLAFRLREGTSTSLSAARFASSVVMGLAISGMHYTGMRASRFAAGALCSGGISLEPSRAAMFIALIALSVMAVTLITAVYDAHLNSQARHDAERLAGVNADLRHSKELFSLATSAAGISCWEYDLASKAMVWQENPLPALGLVDGSEQLRDPIGTLVHPEDRAMLFDTVKQALNAGEDVCAYCLRVIAPDGEIVHLQSHARIILDSERRPLRLLGVSWDVSGAVAQESRRRELQAQLREASREAGMAEVATGVLHNVGNVLNSLGVSASLMHDRLKKIGVEPLSRTAALLLDQGEAVGTFLTSDPRGRQVPKFLSQLTAQVGAEIASLQGEAQSMMTHVDHIRRVIAAQQDSARRGGSLEIVDVAELLDSAVALHLTGLQGLRVIRRYHDVGPLVFDRHRVLQIISNLLGNARHALEGRPSEERMVTITASQPATGRLALAIEDSGSGIAPEVMQRLFEFGFTTKSNGHGFGLHACANLAKEMGGALGAKSDGPGRGATFTLDIGVGAPEQELRRA